MRITRILLIFISTFLLLPAGAQTVVKMDLPLQADRPLTVVALFDEELPEGIPVVLGLMGYDVEGGMSPYSFEWILNGEVISTEDIAIFTPKEGDDISLNVMDDNHCRATTAFNLKTIRGSQTEEDNIRVYPTLFSQEITVQFPKTEGENALIRIFDMKGITVFQDYLEESSSLPLHLNPGSYFISVKSAGHHKVQKIIAQ